MIHLEKINGENVWDILKLKVSDSQKSFVLAMISALLKRIPLLQPTGMLFRLEFMKINIRSAL